MDGTTTQQPADGSANQADDNPPPLPTEAQLPVRPSAAAVPAQRTTTPTRSPAPPTAKVQVKTTMDMVTGHWCQPNVGVSVPPSEFYELVTKEVMARNFPGVLFSRVFWKEEAFVGAKREYLRVQRARIVFDICAAPQGAGSFFSSWLCIVPPQISAAHLNGQFRRNDPSHLAHPGRAGLSDRPFYRRDRVVQAEPGHRWPPSELFCRMAN